MERKLKFLNCWRAIEKKLCGSKERSICDAIFYDSEVERDFDVRLERDEQIKFFIKLLDWFSVDTPLGGYNPDWASVTTKEMRKEGKVYFVIERKTSINELDRRGSENHKVSCSKKYFEVIKAHYRDGVNYDRFRGAALTN